jgi:putative tryptophan/tyrosine transport system substrate-binding protein
VTVTIGRRELLAALGGAAAAWPLAARAQQAGGKRRIGVLMNIMSDDPESQIRLAAFAQGLQQLGWIVGQNVSIDTRWGAGNLENLRRYSAELVALGPDVIMANSSAAVSHILDATHAIPVVFTTVTDPVGAGYVESLAHPGGNITGFTNFEYAIAGKWLELLKEIAPRISRVAVMRESAVAAGPGQFAAIQAAAAPLGIDLRPIDPRDPSEIEHAIAAFAHEPNGGLIVTGSSAASNHRKLIVALAARHRLPVVYNARFYVSDGGLISYGPDFVDQYRRAASYVDRILKGEKPADLPVQAPTKYELVINLTTARALGLEVPPTLLARADEVIE